MGDTERVCGGSGLTKKVSLLHHLHRVLITVKAMLTVPLDLSEILVACECQNLPTFLLLFKHQYSTK